MVPCGFCLLSTTTTRQSSVHRRAPTDPLQHCCTGAECKKVSKVRLVKYIAFSVAADILPYYSHCTAPPPRPRVTGTAPRQCIAKSCTAVHRTQCISVVMTACSAAKWDCKRSHNKCGKLSASESPPSAHQRRCYQRRIGSDPRSM